MVLENIMNLDDKIITYLDDFQQERNELLKSFLERYFYQNFRGENSSFRNIELYIRGNCPNNCAYCYIKKHGKELYPLEISSNEQILNNLKIFLEYYKEQHFKTDFSIFSSDIFRDGFAYKVFDIIYEAFQDIYFPYRPSSIMFPDYGSFLYSQEETDKVQTYIDKLNSVNIRLVFSLSIDGKFMDKNRGDAARTDEFYARAMKFADKNFYAFHPMVSAINIDKWIENYDWWQSDEVIRSTADRLMMLEVRDDNWTPQALNDYIKFLDHVVDCEFQKMNKDKKLFVQRILGTSNYPGKGYDNIFIPFFIKNNGGDSCGSGCSIANNLCVRLGDLAIAPCHRTSYDKYITGNYIVEKGKITGINCRNWEILSAIYTWNRTSFPKCADCSIKEWCKGPCFGSNYEATGDLFWTPNSVCNLFKTQINFLFMKYEEMGLMPEIKKQLDPINWQKIDKYMTIMKGQFENYGDLLTRKISTAIRNGENASGVKLFS